MDSVLALPWWGIAWVAAVVLAAGFAHGAIGFGFPILAMPLLALVLDYKTAILVTLTSAVALTFTSALSGGGLRESIARFWFMPIVLMAGTYLGTLLMIGMDPAPFVLVLALMLLIYLNVDRLKSLEFGAIARNPRFWGLVTAFAAGLFEATANMSGPVLLIYFMMLAVPPTRLVQLLNFSFIGGKLTQLVAWSVSGGIGIGYWLSTLPLAVLAVAMWLVGVRVRSRVGTATYMRWLRKFMWAMVALLLAQYARQALLSA
jgi:hypothetical protein